MSLDIRLHFLERRLWIRLEPEALVDVRMFDAHRLAEQADVVDDRDRGARLLHADFAMAGVIDRGDRVAACALRRIKDIRNRALPGWAADASDPSGRTMAPQRGRVVDSGPNRAPGSLAGSRACVANRGPPERGRCGSAAPRASRRDERTESGRGGAQ